MDKSNTSVTEALHNHFGFDIIEAFQKKEEELKGLAIEIVIDVNDAKSGRIITRSIEYRLMDENFDDPKLQMCDSQADDIQKLLNRIAMLRAKEGGLLNRVDVKLQELQKEYLNKDYKISLNKRQIKSKIIPKDCVNPSTTGASPNRRRRIHSSDSEKHNPSRRQCVENYPQPTDSCSNTLTIGPNGTQMHLKEYDAIYWKDAATATRVLCNIIFGERILGTHLLTGHQLNSSKGVHKSQLDTRKVDDITHLVCSKCGVSKEDVCSVIATKCTDAKKKLGASRKRC